MKPILVFQTDFTYKEGAVSSMYGVVKCVDRELEIMDGTHELPQFDTWSASYRLYQSLQFWPEGTVYVSVVDPGVGTRRRACVAKTVDGYYIVTPDNGSLTHVKKMIGMGKNILGARVLVMGVTFKEDVSDIRNSKVVDIVNELKDFGVDVDVTDPNADSEEVMHEYGFKLIEKPRANYDAVIVAVAHKEYMELDEEYFRGLTYEHAVLGDIKGIYRGEKFT